MSDQQINLMMEINDLKCDNQRLLNLVAELKREIKRLEQHIDDGLEHSE